jgi:hypothetical protein
MEDLAAWLGRLLWVEDDAAGVLALTVEPVEADVAVEAATKGEAVDTEFDEGELVDAVDEFDPADSDKALMPRSSEPTDDAEMIEPVDPGNAR